MDKKFPWNEGKDKNNGFSLLWDGPIRDAVQKDYKLNNNFVLFDIGFHMLIGKNNYYIISGTYQTDEQINQHKINKSSALPGGGVCELFIYGSSMAPAGNKKIFIAENDNKTFCNGVYGIGRTNGQNALLIPVSYYFTEKQQKAKAINSIGKGWRYMTVLLRLKRAGNNIEITQDDTCLGNPNRYPDIPSARRALQKCDQ